MTAPALRRSGTAAASVLAAVLLWLIADPVLGHELRVTEEGGSEPRVMEIGLVPVIMVSLFSALAGWALMAALERLTPRARTVWTVAAVIVLAASFLPLTAPGMTGGTRTWLALMHLAVAAVLVPGLTGPRNRAAPPSRAEHR